VLEQPAVDVEHAFFTAAAFDHVGNKGHGKYLRASLTPFDLSAAGDRRDEGKSVGRGEGGGFRETTSFFLFLVLTAFSSRLIVWPGLDPPGRIPWLPGH